MLRAFRWLAAATSVGMFLVLVMGAGDIYTLTEMVLEDLRW